MSSRASKETLGRLWASFFLCLKWKVQLFGVLNRVRCKPWRLSMVCRGVKQISKDACNLKLFMISWFLREWPNARGRMSCADYWKSSSDSYGKIQRRRTGHKLSWPVMPSGARLQEKALQLSRYVADNRFTLSLNLGPTYRFYLSLLFRWVHQWYLSAVTDKYRPQGVQCRHRLYPAVAGLACCRVIGTRPGFGHRNLRSEAVISLSRRIRSYSPASGRCHAHSRR